MTFANELPRRICLNEGCELTAYRDSLGIWTIGYGFNLERADAHTILAKLGVDVPDGWANLSISGTVASELLDLEIAPLVERARSSLASGVFDKLCDPRKFVVCDLEYNLGHDGWLEFTGTRHLISTAQYIAAGAHLENSDWYKQTGARAVRNVQMMRSGFWVAQ